MKKNEINTFIETMEELGDIWTPDQVEDVFGDDSLESAIDSRKSQLGQFADIIGTVLNR